MLKSAAKVYQHVPDLSEESDDVPVITPLAPPLRVAVQRSCGLSDHHGVQKLQPSRRRVARTLASRVRESHSAHRKRGARIHSATSVQTRICPQVRVVGVGYAYPQRLDPPPTIRHLGLTRWDRELGPPAPCPTNVPVRQAMDSVEDHTASCQDHRIGPP